MPVPLILRAVCGLAVIVKAVAPNIPELNTMLATSVEFEMEIPCTVEVTKVAVSFGPLGTVVGDQLPGKPQLSSWGKLAQVALPAKALLVVNSRSKSVAATTPNKLPRCELGDTPGVVR